MQQQHEFDNYTYFAYPVSISTMIFFFLKLSNTDQHKLSTIFSYLFNGFDY